MNPFFLSGIAKDSAVFKTLSGRGFAAMGADCG